MFDNELTDWNKSISSKKQCLIADNDKKFHATIYYGKDGSMVKLKIIPGRAKRRMQICFLKSNGLYLGKAYYMSGKNDDAAKSRLPLLPPPPPPPSVAFLSDPESTYSHFNNRYIYNHATNDLYVINFEEHPLHDDPEGPDYFLRQLREHIVAVYYFKADLLGEHKYIESVSAIGIFGLEHRRFNYQEAARHVPIVYRNAPPDEYHALKAAFCGDSELVSCAWFTDFSNKTAYRTNVLLDSLLQFDLNLLKNKNIPQSPLPVNIPDSTKFETTFDILDVGRDFSITSQINSYW